MSFLFCLVQSEPLHHGCLRDTTGFNKTVRCTTVIEGCVASFRFLEIKGEEGVISPLQSVMLQLAVIDSVSLKHEMQVSLAMLQKYKGTLISVFLFSYYGKDAQCGTNKDLSLHNLHNNSGQK